MAKSKTAAKPQQRGKHPQPWESDLNPERLAGHNIGAPNVPKHELRPAAEIKELTERLDGFMVDELAQIPVVKAGQRLQQGAVYLDLRDSAARPITATSEMIATDANSYVPKAETPQEYWNRLVESIKRSAKFTGNEMPEETVDKTLEDSFPTSDPPAWTTGREPTKPNQPEAPREKRVEPENK